MPDFPKLRPSEDTLSVKGLQRLPYADAPPSEEPEDAPLDRIDSQKSHAASSTDPHQAELRVPSKNLVRSALTALGIKKR